MIILLALLSLSSNASTVSCWYNTRNNVPIVKIKYKVPLSSLITDQGKTFDATYAVIQYGYRYTDISEQYKARDKGFAACQKIVQENSCGNAIDCNKVIAEQAWHAAQEFTESYGESWIEHAVRQVAKWGDDDHDK